MMYDEELPDRRYLRLLNKRYKNLSLVTEIRKKLRSTDTTHVISEFILKEFSAVRAVLQEEAEVILPLIEQNNPVRKIAEEQHAELIQMVTRAGNGGNHANFPQTFADLLEENIRLELRMLFPLLEKQKVS